MSPVESSVLWSDQVNDSYASTCGMTMVDDVAAKNKSKDHPEAAYAIKWGEKVEITDDLIAQICPADLANHVCEFDFVMPNGCDHNCEMLRLCEIYVAHCGYKCPNTDSDNTSCPYVHGVSASCSSVKRQHTIVLEQKAVEETLGISLKPTAAELKREEKSRKRPKTPRELFTCSMRITGNECPRGHDHQTARLASYALLHKHQHAGRVVHGLETETFEEKMRREGKHQDTQPKNTVSREGTALPDDATLTLVVQSMAYATTEEDLRAAFEKYGAVKRVNVLKKEDGLSKGTAFVDFTRLEHAAKALSAMQGVELDGRTLKIKFKGDRADGQGKDSGAGGSSRACYNCGQEGHMSRDCPSKEPNRSGGRGSYDGSQLDSFGEGWPASEGEGAGGTSWGDAGDTINQEAADDWNNAGDSTKQISFAW